MPSRPSGSSRRLVVAAAVVAAIPLLLLTSTTWPAAPGALHDLHLQQHPEHASPAPGAVLKQVQVVFRHGARAPLSTLYFPNTSWANGTLCPDTYTPGVKLHIQDAQGGPRAPPVIDEDVPVLPGGCRMGTLTRPGYQMALDLGRQLRQQYMVDQPLLSPVYSHEDVYAYTTCIRRTVATLTGVLTGLYGDTRVPVVVNASHQSAEILYGKDIMCAALGPLYNASQEAVQQQEAADAALGRLSRRVVTALGLPRGPPLDWVRLRDAVSCARGSGLPDPPGLTQALYDTIGQQAVRHEGAIYSPTPATCPVQPTSTCQQVVRDSIGGLVWQLLARLQQAAGAPLPTTTQPTATAAAGHAPIHTQQQVHPSRMHAHQQKPHSSDSIEGSSSSGSSGTVASGGGSTAGMVAPAGDLGSSSSSSMLGWHRGAPGASVQLPGHQQEQQQRRGQEGKEEEEEVSQEEERRRLLVTPQRLQEAVQESARQQQQQHWEQQQQQQQRAPSTQAVDDKTSATGRRGGAGPLQQPATTSGGSSRGYQALALYSGHDTTLMPLLSALGQEVAAWPHFAGYLVFELWEVPVAGQQQQREVLGRVQHAHHHQQDQQQQQQQQQSNVHYVRVLYDGQPLRWKQLAGGALRSHWTGNAAPVGRGQGVTGGTLHKADGELQQRKPQPDSWFGRRPAAAGAGGVESSSISVQGMRVGEMWTGRQRQSHRRQEAAAGLVGPVGTGTLQPEGGWIRLEQLQDLLLPFAADRSTHERECRV